MGNDQGNVPLTSRGWSAVGLFLCLTTILFATDTPRSGRCGLFTTILGTTPRPSLPFSTDSPSGFFRLHYATTGPDAVPPADSNGNGIPDYVDEAGASLDSSYRCEVTAQGYLAPPRDAGRGGSDQYDVYLRDLSKEDLGLYGRTVPDTLISQASQPDRYITFIEMDNNFDPTDRNTSGEPIYATTGRPALRVTCAHEFHHAIQLGAYAYSKIQPMLYEMSSTWMEYRVFPDVHDNEQYLVKLLNVPYAYPFADPSASNGYHWWWFGNVLQERGGDALLRAVWERIGTGARPFAALVDACSTTGTSFADLFCSNMQWLYRTGQRSANNSMLPRAQGLPSISFHVDEGAIAPAVTSSGALRTFEVRAFRYTIPSSTSTTPVAMGTLTTNPDVGAMIASEAGTRPYMLRLSTTNSGSATPIPGTTWSLSMDPASNCLFIDGVQTSPPVGPYPQPVVRGTDDAVYLPVPTATQGDDATIRVSTMELIALREERTTAIIDGSRIVVMWSPTSMPHGIFLVEVECNGQVQSYKVVIK